MPLVRLLLRGGATALISSLLVAMSGCADDRDWRHPHEHALGTFDAKAPEPVKPVRFEFHDGLLMNLHHFLVDAARNPDHLEHAPWAQPPSPQELAALRAAAAYYALHYGKQQVFDDDMTAIKHALSVRDGLGSADGLGLPPELAAVLDGVEPIYARVLWPTHRQADEAWINNVTTLNARHGEEIQSRLEHAFSHAFPASIRVDVVYDNGDFRGAYTDSPPPQTVMPSSRGAYNGEASLEMLWHEASHAGAIDTLQADIDADAKALHRKAPEDLWHVALFYTVGYVVQDVYRETEGLDYTPYAVKRGLYTHGSWQLSDALLETRWLPWLQGQGSMREAVTKLVSGLPPA